MTTLLYVLYSAIAIISGTKYEDIDRLFAFYCLYSCMIVSSAYSRLVAFYLTLPVSSRIQHKTSPVLEISPAEETPWLMLYVLFF